MMLIGIVRVEPSRFERKQIWRSRASAIKHLLGLRAAAVSSESPVSWSPAKQNMIAVDGHPPHAATEWQVPPEW